jgi:parafibromin
MELPFPVASRGRERDVAVQNAMHQSYPQSSSDPACHWHCVYGVYSYSSSLLPLLIQYILLYSKMADVIVILQKWAKESKLSEASLDAAGTSLTLADESFPADAKVTVSHDNKTCEYTIASLFLQVVDPKISLPKYRLACKKHKVKDPVKASDKTTVIGFFGLTLAEPAAPPPQEAVVAATASSVPPAVPKPPAKDDADDDVHDKPLPPREERHDKKRHREKDRHHHKHHKSSSRDKRSRHSTGSSSAAAAKTKKAHKPIDANALFTNLTTVVTKRSEKKDKEETELHKALSPEGFEVTPDLLQEHTEVCQAIQANEIPVGNSASILKASAEKDLSPVLKLYIDTMAPSKTKIVEAQRLQEQTQRKWRKHLVGKKPIIVLPKGMTAPITLLNAHEFFGQATFVTRDVMMKRGASLKTIPTTFSRKVGQRLGGGTVEYELMDNPKSKLPTAKDWERVVAVVALGHSWQFKDWPGIYSNPVHLFGRTFGFYVGIEGAKVPTEVQGWSVVKQKVNRDKRGLDSVTYASFWNGLDEFMAIHKPEMLPQDEHK